MTENKYGTATGHPYITQKHEPQVSLQKCLCYLYILAHNMQTHNITKPMLLKHFYQLLGYKKASGASAIVLRSMRGFKLVTMLNEKEKNPHIKKYIVTTAIAKKLLNPPSPTADKAALDAYEALLREVVFSHELFTYLYREQRLTTGIMRRYVAKILKEMCYWNQEIPRITTAYTLSLQMADKPYTNLQQQNLKSNEWWPMYPCSIEEIKHRLGLRHAPSMRHNPRSPELETHD